MVVFELARWRAPPAIILVIVLLTMNSKVPQPMDIQWCEFFAGEGAISLALWSCNLKGSSHDLRYSKLMDLCSVSGFASLDCRVQPTKKRTNTTRSRSTEVGSQRDLEPTARWICDDWHMLQFILRYVTLLHATMTKFCETIYIHAVQPISQLRSRHTAGRDTTNNWVGNTGYDFVRIGNLLLARVVLMVLICSAKGVRWLIEQPENSALPHHPRFQDLLRIVRATWLY